MWQAAKVGTDETMTVFMKPSLDGDQVVSGGPIEHRKLLLTLTNLFFNKQECNVATFRDITELKKLAQIEADNKLLHMLTSSVTHEMVTPLKCMVSFSETVV